MNIWSPGFIQRQRTWVGVGIGVGGLATLGGAAISAGSNGGAPGIEDNYVAGPNSGTSTGVENTWANYLNSANAGNNYNAISPDWNDIWQQTQQQVQNYFGGTATSPGVNDQIDASFAQRGMSGDPAASFLRAQSGANETQDLSNLGAQQDIAQQEFAQQGQSNWLNSLSQFQNASGNTQAEGSWTGAVPYATPGQQIGNAISAAGTGAVGLAAQGISGQNELNFLNAFGNSNGYGNSPSTFATDLITGGENGGTNAFAACWVASELFGGWYAPKTVLARYYVLNIGPKWFLKLYQKYGQKIASFIKDKPILKNILRPLFEIFVLKAKEVI